jgi:Spy/CpxP family protein refolding chaperone
MMFSTIMRRNKMSNVTKAIRFPYSIILALVIALVWAASASINVWAVEHSGGMRGSHFQHGRAMHDFVGRSLFGLLRNEKDLELSQEQHAKIKSIATEYAKTRIQKEADVKLAELDVQSRVHDEKSELSTIESALQKSESARTALRLEGVKALRAAAAVLTPEQREKWRQDRFSRHRTGTHREEYRDQPHATPPDLPDDEG